MFLTDEAACIIFHLPPDRRGLILQMFKRYHVKQPGYHIGYENNDYADAKDWCQRKQIPAHHDKIKNIEEYDIQNGRAYPKYAFRAADSLVDPVQFLRVFKSDRLFLINGTKQDFICFFYDFQVQNLPIAIRNAIHGLRKSICRS